MQGLNEKDCEEIKSYVESFTGIERRYFRYLTIKYCSIKGKPLSEYPIVNILGYDEITTMTIVRDLDNDFNCLMELVKKTKDHAQWEIDEEYFLQQEDKETIKTEEEALASLNPSDDYALDYIPEELRTARVCLEAVKHSPEALLFVPEEQMTVELCLEAVKNNHWLLDVDEVPEELRDEVRRKLGKQ